MAFVLACVAHEALGHGGACLALGRSITQLSSVYFRCSVGSPWIDFAGPANNLLVGLIAWLLLRRFPDSLFLLLAMAFNLCWGFGYFLYSSVTGLGDLAFFLRDLPLEPVQPWRAAFFLIGALGYWGTLKLVALAKPDGATLRLAYLTAGFVACASTLFWPGALLPAMKEAVQESLGASLGLLLLARQLPRLDSQLPFDRTSLLLGIAVTVVFFATLGHGFRL